MRIKNIIERSRRDFTAWYQCEHCGNERKSYGYDDHNFHNNVIPKMKCDNCGKTAGDTYQPLTPKYKPHEVV